jgi:hypothetical protein
MLSMNSHPKKYVDTCRASVAGQVAAYRELMLHDGRLTADNSIKLNPGTSVLQLEVGDEVRVSEEGFQALADAFFSEIEAKYV